MSLFVVKDIEKEYEDGTRALRGVSFNVKKGEFVAIMGPSGSGKSTLLHVLGFLDTPSSGIYSFEGKAFSEYASDEIAHIRNEKMGFVFQMFNLLSRTSVLENVKLPLLYSNVPEKLWEERAHEALSSVGLSGRLSHEPHELSGGERQRVAMARALVNNPPIIFADEPTGNLDSKSGEAVMDILQKLHTLGHTILLITHETDTSKYAERVVYIRDGRIESDKSVEHRRMANHKLNK